ncbi:hypothetical protein PV328_001381 [Microctonus aethiopoides]|uniref:Uncharacterized protein n=1 Tax=Microctonus aethiopoides TaxID=144406 RepID=A0AA39FX61_9HYME|nr:hypothetical protein PV328_001381 [Microctonus aethiopoides]
MNLYLFGINDPGVLLFIFRFSSMEIISPCATLQLLRSQSHSRKHWCDSQRHEATKPPNAKNERSVSHNPTLERPTPLNVPPPPSPLAIFAKSLGYLVLCHTGFDVSRSPACVVDTVADGYDVVDDEEETMEVKVKTVAEIMMKEMVAMVEENDDDDDDDDDDDYVAVTAIMFLAEQFPCHFDDVLLEKKIQMHQGLMADDTMVDTADVIDRYCVDDVGRAHPKHDAVAMMLQLLFPTFRLILYL